MEPPRDAERLWPEMIWPCTRKSVQIVYFDLANRSLWITHYTSHDDQHEHWPKASERATLPEVPTVEGWFDVHPVAVTSTTLTTAVDVEKDPLAVASISIPHGALPLAARALARAIEADGDPDTIRRLAKRGTLAAFVMLAAAQESGRPQLGIEPVAGMPWLKQPNDMSLQIGEFWQDRFIREHRVAMRDWMLALVDSEVDAMFRPYVPSEPPNETTLRSLLEGAGTVGRFPPDGLGASFDAIAPVAVAWLRSDNPWAWVHGFTLLGSSDADFDAIRAERAAEAERRERSTQSAGQTRVDGLWERLFDVLFDYSNAIGVLCGVCAVLFMLWVVFTRLL